VQLEQSQANPFGHEAVERRSSSWTRGVLLLEALLAVALFAGAAAFTLGCISSVFAALDRTRREQQAVDIARSRMSELQAGLITLADLRSRSPSVGDVSAQASSRSPAADAWTVDVHTQPTEFTGLRLVELTVSEEPKIGSAGTPMSYTLRELVALRGADAGARDE
jgi:type II secretory pathway pseudopilin PulG